MKKANPVDDYFRKQTPEIKKRLEEIRLIILKAAPGAEETISYGMPAVRKDKILVYYAAFKNHIGFFPTSSGIKAFESQLGEWKWSKGTIQFPYEKPYPKKLISAIVAYRMDQVNAEVMAKSKRTCRKGHVYFKTSDCPTCPICEAARKPTEGILSLLSAPARRALESAGWTSPASIAVHSEKELLALHGLGPSSIPKIRAFLKKNGLELKKKK